MSDYGSLIYDTLCGIPADLSGIYAIVLIATGHIYIGSSHNIRIRCEAQFKELRLGLHRNPVLQAAWRRYGPHAFHLWVLEPVRDLSHIREREQFWIERLGTLHPNGFNRQPIRDTRIPPNLARVYLAGSPQEDAYWTERDAILQRAARRREARQKAWRKSQRRLARA